MAKLSHRVFAGFFAALFLITSSTVAIAFIVGDIESNNSSSSTAADKSSSSTAATTTGQKLAGFTPVAAVSQLKITNLTVGTGPSVKPGATISADYTGAVAATGIIFQSSSSPVTFSLDQVIDGWAEGVPGMQVGGERQLLIPAASAYGANPPSGSGIPANAALVFDITLKSIVKN